MNNNNLHDYSHLAKDYDHTRYESDFRLFLDKFRHDAFIDLADANVEKTLLDVGTGTGSGIIFFSQYVKHVTGLDGTQAMLDFAHTKIESLGLKNTKLVCSNALELPFEDNTFDIVTSLNFIHLFANQGIKCQSSFLNEMSRVVKPNGKVLVEFDNRMFTRELGNRFSDMRNVAPPSLKIDKIIGTYMPLMKYAHALGTPIASAYGKLARLPACKRISSKWVVRYCKST